MSCNVTEMRHNTFEQLKVEGGGAPAHPAKSKGFFNQIS